MTPMSPCFPEISLNFRVASIRPPYAFPRSHAPPPRKLHGTLFMLMTTVDSTEEYDYVINA